MERLEATLKQSLSECGMLLRALRSTSGTEDFAKIYQEVRRVRAESAHLWSQLEESRSHERERLEAVRISTHRK